MNFFLLTTYNYELGIRCFDDLTFGQKISTLAIMGNGLLRKDVPIVRLTAVLEGAIAAVFQHLKYHIVYEIDVPESRSNWRELVVAARKEMDGEDIPSPACDDMKEWETQVEELADCILWDADYEDDQMYIDFPPEKSEWLKDMADISDNYFLAIADDLTDEEAEAQIKELKKLCDSIIEP